MKRQKENINAILQFLSANGFAGDVKELMGIDQNTSAFGDNGYDDINGNPEPDLAAITQEYDAEVSSNFPGREDDPRGRDPAILYAVDNPEKTYDSLSDLDDLEIMESPMVVISGKEDPIIIRTQNPQIIQGRVVAEGTLLKITPKRESTEVFKTIDDKDKFFKFLSAQVKEKSLVITQEAGTFTNILKQFISVVYQYQETQNKYLDYVKSYTATPELPGGSITANVNQQAEILKMEDDSEDIKELENNLETLSTQYTLMSTEANRTIKDLYGHFTNLFQLTNQMNGFAQNEIHNRIQKNY